MICASDVAVPSYCNVDYSSARYHRGVLRCRMPGRWSPVVSWTWELYGRRPGLPMRPGVWRSLALCLLPTELWQALSSLCHKSTGGCDEKGQL